MTDVTSKRRGGRVSFADTGFASSTSLTALPDTERTPTSARLDELAHNPNNPRDGYAGESLDELAASMTEVGQLQPATVVARDVFLAHYPETADALGRARWVVVMGNRRLAAARTLAWERLAIVAQDHLGGTDPRLTEALLMENLHREALPPLLEARELQALVDRHGSQAAVAKRLAKTSPWVSQRLSLLRLTPALQEQLRAGEMSFREARAVASESADGQEQALATMRGASTEVATDADTSPSGPFTAGNSDPRGEDVAAPRRRGRPRKVRTVDDVARDIRRDLSTDDIARLVELLTSGG